jgi:hypothetical protein
MVIEAAELAVDCNAVGSEVELELCTCAAKSGVIGHAAFCPLGVGLGEKADQNPNDDDGYTDVYIEYK